MFLHAVSELLRYDVTMLKVDWTFLRFSKNNNSLTTNAAVCLAMRLYVPVPST